MKPALEELKGIHCLTWLGFLLFLFLFIPKIADGEEIQTPLVSIPQKSQIKTLIVADYYPYTFVSKEGVPAGFSVDLVKAVATVMGMNLDIGTDTWEHAVKHLETGEIDFLPMMAYSAERDKIYDFSVPHTIAFDAFFTRKDVKRLNSMDDLKGRTVIVMKGDQAHDFLRSSDLVDSGHVILINSLPEALRLLSSGKADAALMPKLVGLTLINNLNLTNLTQSPVVVESYSRPFSFAVKKGNLLLLEQLNQGLNILKQTGQYREIYDKWFGAMEPREVTLKSVLKYVVSVLLALLIIGSAFAVWSFSLRKQVILRTKKLTDEIAERKDAELRFRQITETIREVFWLGSLDWKELYYVSPAYEQVWGRTRWELYQNPLSWFDSVDDEEHRMIMAAIFQPIPVDTRKIVLPDYRIRKADGSIAWISMRAFPVPDASGVQYRIAGIAEDVTERRQADAEILRLNAELEQRVIKRTAQLEATNRELEAFSYSVSHDLRTPLRHINGYVELLVTRCRDSLNDKGKHYVDIIADSARLMGDLIDHLLQFSRTGRAEMHPERLDMNRAVQDSLALLKEIHTERTIEWIIGDLPAVYGDYAMLCQVWTNLLDNAMKYTRMKETAKIEIGARKENRETLFFVRDNGAGFDMRYAGKLFGVFQRLHSLEEFEGTGIGLANVHRIITRHGGRVWAESVLDQGATFYFTLPESMEETHA